MIEPRDAALTALYAIDLAGDSDLAGLGAKAKRLVRGVAEHLEVLDARINQSAQGWRVDRMPAVDRSILRLAAFELLYEPETPDAVVVSEAVRLAKLYSTQKSSGFVNGVLADIAEAQPSA